MIIISYLIFHITCILHTLLEDTIDLLDNKDKAIALLICPRHLIKRLYYKSKNDIVKVIMPGATDKTKELYEKFEKIRTK